MKTTTDDPRLQDLIEGIFALLRGMLEDGQVLPKHLYMAGPGVSRTTVSRIMQGKPSADMALSTLFNLVDRLPMQCRQVVAGELCREWGLRVQPIVRQPVTDKDGDDDTDEQDLAIGLKHVADVVNRIVGEAIQNVASRQASIDDTALHQRLRQELQAYSEDLTEIIAQMATVQARRQARRLTFPRKEGA